MGGVFSRVYITQNKISTKQTNAKIIPIIKKVLKIEDNTIATIKYNCQYGIPFNMDGSFTTIAVTLYAKYIKAIAKI